MTNIYFKTIGEYQDIEVRNAWRQWVDSGRVDAQDMLRWLAKLSRDNSRTPMQWNDGPNAGFTTGTPWLPVNRNYLEINAQRQLDDPDSVFNYYRRLIELRHSHGIIVYGEFIPLLENDASVYAYRRRLDGAELTVLCNWTDRTAPCALNCDASGEELISNYPQHKAGFLYPYEARALLRRG